jgi:membrane fusion protein, multidrug efflux system
MYMAWNQAWIIQVHRWMLLVALMASLGAPATWAKVDKAQDPKPSELNTVRGVVKSSSEAVLSSQIEGRISTLPFKDGQRFKKGQILVVMDCAKYEAELASATAEHEARKKTHANNLRLSDLRAIGRLEVEISEAEVKKALAATKIAQVKVSGCRIMAPFSGRVVKVMAHEHENIFPNDQLLSILDDSQLEIELLLPSRSLTWLKNGSGFGFTVDETGRGYAARVTEIGASVDPASQTVRVIGEFEGTPADVLTGMSGTATFNETPGY